MAGCCHDMCRLYLGTLCTYIEIGWHNSERQTSVAFSAVVAPVVSSPVADQVSVQFRFPSALPTYRQHMPKHVRATYTPAVLTTS
jgi:hypothetical protein